MTKVHANLPNKEIPVPSNVTTASICQRTGKLASPGCRYAHTEYFVKGTVPSKYCNNSSGNYTDFANESEESVNTDATASENGENANTGAENDTSINLDNNGSAASTPAPQKTENQPVPQNSGDVITLD